MLSDATKIAILKSAPKLSHIELIELVAEECRLAPREWVELTNEEMLSLAKQFKASDIDIFDVMSEVEDSLKEKNHYA